MENMGQCFCLYMIIINMNNHILVIINPFSGKKKGKKIIPNIQSALKKYALTFDINITKYANHAKEIVANLDANKYSKIIIYGGDGTFNEVVNGLLLRQDDYSPTLGFLPGGSGNSMMHDLGLLDPIKALAPILNNQISTLDVMKLSFKNHVEYAINIVGLGLATDIGSLAEKMRFLGPSRYLISSMISIFLLKKRECIIKLNHQVINDSFLFVLVCNTQYTGTGMRAAPHALLNDGLLDVIILKKEINRYNLFNLLPKIFSGEHIHSPFIDYIQCDTVELKTNYNENLNIDGEIKQNTPVQIQILKNKLKVFK